MGFVYKNGIVVGADFGRGPQVDRLMLSWYEDFITQGKVRLAKADRIRGHDASPDEVNNKYS